MSTISSYTLKSGPRAAAGETPLFAVADWSFVVAHGDSNRGEGNRTDVARIFVSFGDKILARVRFKRFFLSEARLEIIVFFKIWTKI
jgi:hypothetical protein